MTDDATELFGPVAQDLGTLETQLKQEIASDPPEVAGPMSDLFEAGGKRIRPALVLLAARCGEYEPDRVFPAAMAVNGLMLCLEGRLYWGRLYVAGLLDLLVAVALGAWLDLAPLLFALWNSAVLVWMALYLRRRAWEYEATLPAQAAQPAR